ncbi:MAG: AAA family ATPase, partial [Huintestinicola sp.]
MLCSRCKKREAMVFITSMQGSEKRNEGLCLVCARELNVPQIKEYMDQMGVTDDDIEEFADAMSGVKDNFDMEMFNQGGTNSLPGFFNALFGGGQNDNKTPTEKNNAADSASEASERRERIKNGKETKNKKRKFLSSFCTDLTARAKEGKLDTIIGRDKEIARTIQILCRRQKNNPCLIGEPGVGKTAIAEGLAQKIAAGEVPFQLADKEVFLLDLTALVAGTQFRGQFESRMKGLVDEVKAEGNIILFIDEIHNIVGAGDSEGSSMNAANILKPPLSRGEVQVIGATTFKEYRKYIEKDSALERRFQPVTVNEPTVEDTVEVLKGIKHYYEEHHKVKISDELIRLCAVLSERYINDRYLPDKAIDLLDEACANRSISSVELAEHKHKTAEVAALEAEIKSLEDGDEPDFEALAEKKSQLIREQNELDALTKKISAINVTEQDLARVIELWTGIPASKIEETELKKLVTLESSMKKRIIGQDKAVELAAKAIKRSRAQLSKRRRPASFIFVGPTGVGKT